MSIVLEDSVLIFVLDLFVFLFAHDEGRGFFSEGVGLNDPEGISVLDIYQFFEDLMKIKMRM